MIRKKDIRQDHFFGISQLSVIPIRAYPDDKSEIVTQVLFGESFKILDKRGENWLLIACSWDGYTGWCDEKMITYINETAYRASLKPSYRSSELVHQVTIKERNLPILMGSALPQFDGMVGKLGNNKYHFSGQAIQIGQSQQQADLIEKLALKYLNAPYLWGGRSPFGIDCSGFVQVVYQMLDVKLPRDAKDQAEVGEIVDFAQTAQKGDLAFFENPSGKIIHVGIILDKGKIIHASGKVRIDYFDHYGIYQMNRRKYSHMLRVIRRVV